MEDFRRRLNKEPEIQGLKEVHDDVLVYGVLDINQDVDHDRTVTAILDGCREKNIPYLAHTLSSSGLKVGPSTVTAIKDIPAPTDKKDACVTSVRHGEFPAEICPKTGIGYCAVERISQE